MKTTDPAPMELLAPAGSMDALIAAVNAGADAAYMGGKKFGARAFADNPDDDGLLKAIDYVHLSGRKLFLTVNTLFKQSELEEELIPYLKPLYEQGLDGVILQDLGVIRTIREVFPDLPVHLSTQGTLCGPDGAKLMKELGVKRLVLPRELSLKEIREIYEESGMDLEVFVHGALCYCYSGQCLMSSFLGGRSGNRGRCAQPCRLDYEGGRLLNLKDLCGLRSLPDLREAGAMSLKVEGRMKSPEYTAGVISVYRKYLDLLAERGAKDFRVDPADEKALSALFDRGGFTEGYYRKHNGRDMLVTGEKNPYVTASEGQLQDIREKYLGRRPVPAEGTAFLRLGSPALLTAESGGRKVTAEGDAVQTAAGKPLSPADVEKQLRKTGDSGFAWTSLAVKAEENCFLPVSRLNALRRDALDGLKAALLEPYRRKFTAPVPKNGKNAAKSAANPVPELYVELDDPAQLDTVLTYPDVCGIYLQSDYVPLESLGDFVRKAHDAGKKLYLAFPHVFRSVGRRRFLDALPALASAGADGYLLRSVDEAGFLREVDLPGERIFDAGIYCWNRESAAMCRDFGASVLTYPREPHEKDLRELEPVPLPLEMIVYGRIPMMLSAQCVAKTLGKCRRDMGRPALTAPSFEPLKDRTGAVLPVETRCRDCCSVIYNAVPLWLADMALPRAERLRLSFTDESERELRTVLDAVTEGLKGRPERLKPPAGLAFTRGHYRKGVQ